MTKDRYRSQSKKLMLAGYKLRVRKNEPGSAKVYTRYWADAEGHLLGEVGDEALEKQLLNKGTKMGTKE